jgi:hypothetical protein
MREPAAALRRVLPVILCACGLLAGCAGIERREAPAEPSATAAPSESELRIREVFVFQGRVANDLLERYQFDAPPGTAADPALAAAEAHLTDSCTYLNQAAVTYLEGGEPGWRLKMRMLATADDCESAAHALARLLAPDGQPIVASYTDE